MAVFSGDDAEEKIKAIAVKCVFEGFYVSASTKHLSYMLGNVHLFRSALATGVSQKKKKSYSNLLFGQNISFSCSHQCEPVGFL